MPVYFDRDKSRWRFEFNRVIRGQRTRATKLLPAAWGRTKAEAYDRKETDRLYAIATGLEQPEPSIARAVELYIDHRLPKLRKKAKRPKRIVQELAHLAGYIDGRPMSQLGDVCREYAEENPDFAAGTVRNRLAYLRAACRYAWRKHKLTTSDPTGHMELPLVNNARDVRLPVTDYEQRILKPLRAIDVGACAIYTLAFYMGCRWESEIHPRQPADVHRMGRKVRVQIGMTKNGTPRFVPVHPKARWALAYLPFKWGSRYYYERFVKAREAAGLPGLWVHDGRHVVATDIVAHGGTLADVQAALHHLSAASSERYAHILTEHTERVLFGIGKRGATKVHTGGTGRRARQAA